MVLEADPAVTRDSVPAALVDPEALAVPVVPVVPAATAAAVAAVRAAAIAIVARKTQNSFASKKPNRGRRSFR